MNISVALRHPLEGGPWVCSFMQVCMYVLYKASLVACNCRPNSYQCFSRIRRNITQLNTAAIIKNYMNEMNTDFDLRAI